MGKLAVSKRSEETDDAAEMRHEQQTHGLCIAQRQKRQARESNGKQEREK